MPVPWTRVRSQLASAAKAGEPPEILDALRRDLRVARADVYLRELVTSSPPPTPGQRRALASILASGDDDGT